MALLRARHFDFQASLLPTRLHAHENSRHALLLFCAFSSLQHICRARELKQHGLLLCSWQLAHAAAATSTPARVFTFLLLFRALRAIAQTDSAHDNARRRLPG